MKQILLILLVFISFQGFSQTKIESVTIGKLKVMTTDLGKMTWDEAEAACEKLGNGWRLPTKEEFEKILYPNKSKIPNRNTEGSSYWSSTYYASNAYDFHFGGNGSASICFKSGTSYVRAVRTIK
jgi:hypothetical protein